MSSGSQSAAPRGVEQVARALFGRGAGREAVAMLRGAIARDGGEEGCANLLAEVLAGRAHDTLAGVISVELDLSLVDGWIRRGMLVEALALLGGTPMGSLETGQEWANLLGELLAPVPVDVDETLEETHRQLLSGGASVALSLLEERARREPGLPAWAQRRLEVLRWMLLDNASSAESAPELADEVPSLLAGAIRGHVHQRNLEGALQAARAFAASHPNDADAARTSEALETLMEEINHHLDEGSFHGRTMPVVGHPAAAMQLRMGNLAHAASVYRKMVAKDPNDRRALRLAVDVEALLRALEGAPVAEDVFGGDSTSVVMSLPADEVTARTDTGFGEAMRSLGDALSDLDIPGTNVTQVPGAMAASESARPSAIGGLDGGPTLELPDVAVTAERLAAEGQLEEAENVYRGLASIHPNDPEWPRRADALRRRRDAEADSVLVHSIKKVR